jgi:uncharacterized protein (TIGR02646 family)
MMRPIDRGDWPRDATGARIPFAHYREARDHLIHRIGDYCSYCEACLHGSIHVEHVRPKRPQPALEREWTNFLLGCDQCNAIKGDRDVNLDDYYWPDRDNTARVFRYDVDQPPRVTSGLMADQQAIAQRTIALTGLDRVPGHPDYSDRDRRWKKRLDAWGVALTARGELERNDTPALRRQILQTAIARGHWSVWMQVLHNDIEMRTGLVEWFQGTARNCFDAETRPIPRLGGRV